MNRAVLLLLCLWLGGCVSIPLSTIVRMSTFDEQDFVALNPDVVRVRITLPQVFKLDAGQSSLGVKITSPAGVHYGDWQRAPRFRQACFPATHRPPLTP